MVIVARNHKPDYLVEKEEETALLQREIYVFKEIQKTGLDFLVDFETGQDGDRRRIYTSKDLSIADQFSLDKYSPFHQQKQQVTVNLNFYRNLEINNCSIPLYCRENHGDSGKLMVLSAEFAFTDNNEMFYFSIKHNWNLAKLLDHLMSKGLNHELAQKAETEVKKLHQKYPLQNINGNYTEGMLIQDDFFKELFF